MKKFAIAFVVLMFLMIVACGGTEASKSDKYAETTIVAQDGTRVIIRHTETGVCYLFVKSGYSGAMV